MKIKKKQPKLTPPQQFHRAAQKGDLETCTEMAAQWLTSTTAQGNTALHWASSAGHTQVVHMLVTAGADVTMTNDMLDTALHSAAWRGFAEVAELLLQSGASRQAVNKEGKTPPQLAAQKFAQDHPIIQVLPKFTEAELNDVGGDSTTTNGPETEYLSSSDDSQCEELASF